VLLVEDSERAFSAGLWLCAWLFTSNGFPAEVLENPVAGPHLQRAVSTLNPRAVLLHLGPRIDGKALQRTLHNLPMIILAGGPMLLLHENQLRALELPNLALFETPQVALRLLQAQSGHPVEMNAPCT